MNFPLDRRFPYSTRQYGFATLAAVAVAILLAACGADVDYAPADANPPVQSNEANTPTPENPSPSPTPEQQTEVEEEPTPSPTPIPDDDDSEAADPTPTPMPSGSDDDGAEERQEADPTPTPEPEPEPLELPSSAYISDMTHMYQTWNNCSAASACMLLSVYDIHIDQEALRPILRPNDDAKHGKSERMIAYFAEHDLRSMLMHGGDVETLKAFLANDIPIIVQQWLAPDSDPIGHYRVVRGYDDDRGIFRVNDSMFGSDVHYTYQEFDEMWRAFSYRYIPVYPAEKDEVVERILGEQLDRNVNRQLTAQRIERELQDRPNDAELWFSLGTNLFDLGRDAEAIEAYERAASIGLTPKMLWYVYWPAAAYNNIGNHDQAIRVATEQIATANTFGDMRYERGRAFEARGEIGQAIAEYQRALSDDPYLREAHEALERLGAT